MSKSKKTSLKISKSKIYFLISAAVLLAGVLSYTFIVPKLSHEQTGQTTNQAEKKDYDAYEGINKDDIESIGLLWEIGFDYGKIPIVALVRIDSIDGGRNYSPIYERYGVAETYGKMTVLDVYRGNVRSGQELKYSRGGGIITAREYLNALNAPGSEETYLRGHRPSEKKYVKEYVVDDIDVEVGKNYLAFLTPQSSKDGRYHEYAIRGAQFGFREARGSGAEATVLDYGTGKWVGVSSMAELN